ncbi:hypothetical protein OG373_13770 [Streptomyces avidinii]|uniref:hypothetical protein n=1 Tax=Streptomyces avidinii TaxID=1895 RepID=UPI00386FF54D|nr:hypothetical protein OG373_13770 [Streptomyces avidinii]
MSTEQQIDLAAVVAAMPVINTVGELRTLLEQLPDEMGLCLDEHYRAVPDASNHGVLIVTPRLVDYVIESGTSAPRKMSELTLTQVYVPSSRAEQAAVASRDDLPPFSEYPQAQYYLEGGELGLGLKGLSWVLGEVAYLVRDVGVEHVQTGSDVASALQVEAERIADSGMQIRKLADEVEATG